jgi:hypothetical protein
MESYTVKADAAAHYVRTVILTATKDRTAQWEKAADPVPFARELAGTPDTVGRLMVEQGWEIDRIDGEFGCAHSAKKDGSRICSVKVAVRATRTAMVDQAEDGLDALHVGLERSKIHWPAEIGPWKLAYRSPVACTGAEPVRELAPGM